MYVCTSVLCKDVTQHGPAVHTLFKFTHTARWIVVFQLLGKQLARTSVFLSCCIAEVSSSENRGCGWCEALKAETGWEEVMLRLFAAPKKQQEAAEMAQVWYFA